MSASFVPFDSTWRLAREAVVESGIQARLDAELFLVRNMLGRVRLLVDEETVPDAHDNPLLTDVAARLRRKLANRGYPADNGVYSVGGSLLRDLKEKGSPLDGLSGVYKVERLVTGAAWSGVDCIRPGIESRRCTLYSVKGGVGRSTTAAYLAHALARRGGRVLVIDLDLESPGLSSALLEPERRPKFGVTDWFVEELVGQGDDVIPDMLAMPEWAADLQGSVQVAPAHGASPGEYLYKLGRVFMLSERQTWSGRLRELVRHLEELTSPTVTLIESRSGLHDIAASAVTDLEAEVLLFATNSQATWDDYGILFEHWESLGVNQLIRERLTMVSALTPPDGRKAYLNQFCPRAWDLFRDYLYDAIDPQTSDGSEYSFDLNDPVAPHWPLEINWARALSGGAPIRDLDEAALNAAYGRFDYPFLVRILEQ